MNLSPLIVEGEDHQTWIRTEAKKQLCESSSACGSCASCRMLLSGYHPDLILVPGDISVEVLRDSLRELRTKPVISSVRVLAITDGQDLSPHVQNALLKTIEEPLAHWYLYLGCRSRSRLLPTILSRCMRLYIPKTSVTAALDEKDSLIFEAVTQLDEITAFENLDKTFEDRKKTKIAWTRLLEHASAESYPGFWSWMAEPLLHGLEEIDRNLHPRLVWTKAWGRASEQKERHETY